MKFTLETEREVGTGHCYSSFDNEFVITTLGQARKYLQDNTNNYLWYDYNGNKQHVDDVLRDYLKKQYELNDYHIIVWSDIIDEI